MRTVARASQLLLVPLCVLVIHLPSHAQKKAQVPAAGSPVPTNPVRVEDDRRLQIDRERLDFDKQKFNSDRELAEKKLRQDDSHGQWIWLGPLLTFVVGFLTLGYSVWSFRKQAVQTATLQKEAAALQFEIKAAEIAFAGKTPTAVQNRAHALKKVFDTRLPASFPAPLDVDALGEKKESPAEKLQFLELLLKYPDRQRQAFELWKALFGDEWLDRVDPVIAAAPPSAPTSSAAAPQSGTTSSTMSTPPAGSPPAIPPAVPPPNTGP